MWTFEKKYVAPDEIDYGPLPRKRLTHGWLTVLGALWVLLGISTFLAPGSLAVVPLIYLALVAVVFARLAALDLCYLLLLNIYTLPLFLLGILYQSLFGVGIGSSLAGALVAGAIGVLLSLFMALFKRQEGEFGMGDIKMLMVMGAWVGLGALPFAFSIAFIANLVLAFCISSRQAIPFGFGLVIGTWVMAAFKAPFMAGLFYLFG